MQPNRLPTLMEHSLPAVELISISSIAQNYPTEYVLGCVYHSNSEAFRSLFEIHTEAGLDLPPFKPDPDLPNPFDISDELPRFLPQHKVGILGAGVGGLYAALILDSLDIECEVLEASGRTGGRLSTYKFPNGGKYDYYEAGAMRFPLPKKDADGQYKNGVMKRLAQLTEYGPLNEGRDRLKDKLIPYYFSARKGSQPGFYYFNGIFQSASTEPKGSFNAQAMSVHDDYIRAGANVINKDVINPFARMLIKDLQTNETRGWDVMKANDSDNLELPPHHLPNNVINWCGLLESSSGGYDRALTESVFASLAFAKVGNTDYGDVDWKCFEGGSEVLSKKMEEYIRKKGVSIQFETRVTAIGQGQSDHIRPRAFPMDELLSGKEETLPESVDLTSEEARIMAEKGISKRVRDDGVNVTVNGTEIRTYSHVISTLPLPVLRTLDLNNAGLGVMQRNALRALDYGPSIKIAILFKSNWWTTKLGIVGGQSFTDLPIRTIVYPSYGVDSRTPSKVLIASYCWTTDADRLGALSVMKEREVLEELVLRNLAEAHSRLNPEISYKYLKSEFVDMDVKDWNRDEYTMGLRIRTLSPGQFEDLYTSFNTPAANNRLHFAGEALSTRHAWVVGALDSAWKAVYQYLKVTSPRDSEKIKKFKEIWGENVEWTGESTLVDPGDYGGHGPDLLDQHLGLVSKATLGGVIM
ncbi:hypothetical protein J3R83DRAFT_5939 [Lanmaoa asiatica]|nr:hypothetical protein J3R83DRAFT_5939 [Lanmaoa asiatica]